jgi:hypothetical protein
MVIELIAVTHEDPLGCVERIEREFGYAGRVMVGDDLVDARAVLTAPHESLSTCNVVFTPR